MIKGRQFTLYMDETLWEVFDCYVLQINREVYRLKPKLANDTIMLRRRKVLGAILIKFLIENAERIKQREIDRAQRKIRSKKRIQRIITPAT